MVASTTDDAAIARCMLTLLNARGADASACPSDVARALVAGEAAWRSLMPRVRAVARALARAGRLRVTQGVDVLDPDASWRGPVRLRLP